MFNTVKMVIYSITLYVKQIAFLNAFEN